MVFSVFDLADRSVGDLLRDEVGVPDPPAADPAVLAALRSNAGPQELRSGGVYSVRLPTYRRRKLVMARQSIEVEHLSHGSNPIPAACRVGNVIMTGGIAGRDPATGDVPDDARLQVAHAFTSLHD
jgi:hypothetical protein